MPGTAQVLLRGEQVLSVVGVDLQAWVQGVVRSDWPKPFARSIS